MLHPADGKLGCRQSERCESCRVTGAPSRDASPSAATTKAALDSGAFKRVDKGLLMGRRVCAGAELSQRPTIDGALFNAQKPRATAPLPKQLGGSQNSRREAEFDIGARTAPN